MPKIEYVEKKFAKKSLALIKKANEIIDEYLKAGYKLTLRQLYYQFVARNIIPNTIQNYKNLGSLISDARLGGFIDWESIEDRTRELVGRPHWDNPHEIVQACAKQYHVDWWKGQDVIPEVWIEKDALAGVFDRVCREFDVPFFSCRGYNSQSAMWESAQRIGGRDQDTVILHFGDHDPSGIDMTRDMKSRLEMFEVGDRFVMNRIALTKDQVTRYKLPPNPAKETDSRHAAYIAKHGTKCWELDSLDVKVLSGLVQRNIEKLIDNPTAWKKRVKLEKAGQGRIQKAANTMKRKKK